MIVSCIRGFSKTSVFGKSTLDLTEKLAILTVFLKPFPKLTEFWKWLITQTITFTIPSVYSVYFVPLCDKYSN